MPLQHNASSSEGSGHEKFLALLHRIFWGSDSMTFCAFMRKYFKVISSFERLIAKEMDFVEVAGIYESKAVRFVPTCGKYIE
mmetsp:Transcript_1476/g.1995  ORF Transcript_1476/g.1995 Transcript_1476/m.1995 type:complete len:82 (+) Transcript_1476:321-566(+)